MENEKCPAVRIADLGQDLVNCKEIIESNKMAIEKADAAIKEADEKREKSFAEMMKLLEELK